jgi:dynactin complex subunit
MKMKNSLEEIKELNQKFKTQLKNALEKAQALRLEIQTISQRDQQIKKIIL